VSAAAPVFIADAPILHAEGFGRAVGGAFLGERAAAGKVAVFDPIAHLARRAAAEIPGEVRFGADEAAELQEFVRAELVGFDGVAPPDVDAARPARARADAVAPVVVVGEAAARPAQHRHADFLQRVDDVLADAAEVGDLGVFSDADAVVDARPKMLGKMPVQERVDPGDGLVQTDGDLCSSHERQGKR